MQGANACDLAMVLDGLRDSTSCMSLVIHWDQSGLDAFERDVVATVPERRVDPLCDECPLTKVTWLSGCMSVVARAHNHWSGGRGNTKAIVSTEAILCTKPRRLAFAPCPRPAR